MEKQREVNLRKTLTIYYLIDAFANCWSLTRITIPESVTKIDEDAFFNTLSDIHIECFRDSYAHKWAMNHKAKFELIEK